MRPWHLRFFCTRHSDREDADKKTVRETDHKQLRVEEQNMKIGFIGLGNMAKAMIGGMLEKQIVRPEEIIGTAKTEATRERVRSDYGIEIRETNAAVAKEADILVLAVKPQFFEEVIGEIRTGMPADTLVISIAAGKTMKWIEEAFGRRIKLVRCMPNTPALVGEGCTGVCVNDKVSQQEKDDSLRLMESFGRAHLVPEHLMNAVGAVSGSSPAYVFMFIEAMADAAVAAGLPRTQAYEFAAQAVYGSAKLMLDSGRHPAELKDMVCSPGGTTIQGVRVLEERGMRGAVIDALTATVEQSNKL